MKVFNCLFIICIALAAAALPACAGITIIPDRHVVVLPAGEEKRVSYEIDNSGASDIEIEIEPQDWSGINKDIYSWISLRENYFKVSAGEKKSFSVDITAPEDANGEMLAMLFLCYKENEGSLLNIRNGVPLYLVIKGTEDYSAEIADLKINFNPEGADARLDVTVTAKNTGNIHIMPDIKVAISDARNRELKNFLLEKSHRILRAKGYDYMFTWMKPVLPDGNYKVLVELRQNDTIGEIVKEYDFIIKNRKASMAGEE